jgi:hypothetical protein
MGVLRPFSRYSCTSASVTLPILDFADACYSALGQMAILISALHVLKRSRWYRRLLWAGAAFLVYVLVGFFVLPPIIKSQLVKRLPAITKRQAASRQVKFNPLVL